MVTEAGATDPVLSADRAARPDARSRLRVAAGAAGAPMLLRLHRRTGSWRAPAELLALFAAVFVVSTLIVGPALSDDDDEPAAQVSEPSGHEAHHP